MGCARPLQVGSQPVLRVGKAPKHRFPAQDLEGFEERETHGASHRRHPDRGLCLAELAPVRASHGGHDLFDRLCQPPIPRQLLETRSRRGQDRARLAVPRDGLVPRAAVHRRLADAQELDVARYFSEDRDALAHQRGENGPLPRLVHRCTQLVLGLAGPCPATVRELGIAQLADVDAIEMPELLQVEEGRRVVHVFEPESLDELVSREQLVAVRKAPTEQGEVVPDRLWQIALEAVVLDGDPVASLGDLLATVVDEHWQVREQW